MNRAVAVARKTVVASRLARAIALGSTAAVALTMTAPSAQALTINTYTSGFTSAELALIGNAVNFYQTTFSDAITVNIGLQAVTDALGESQSYVYLDSYANYRAKLAADATSLDDATAVASLPGSASGGITPGVTMKLATARAVGFNPGAGGASSGLFCSAIAGLPSLVDACIGIGTSATSTTPFTTGKYYFLTVLEHEMDEVLGTGSDLTGGGTIFTGQMAVEDLFRYNAPGSREFAIHACDASYHGPAGYLSLDGGTTNLANYNNCTNGGDYGDYTYLDSPAQVQDAFGTTGGGLSLNSSSTEIRDLDALGYTRAVVATPEPASLVLLATGFLGIAGVAARRKVQAK